jgi:hypothetical protein
MERRARSASPPGSWSPRIGRPFSAAMSTAWPKLCADTLPKAVKKLCPVVRLLTDTSR